MENGERERQELVIETKEEAVKALENLSVLVYSRMKGKGLSLIENILPDDSEALEPNKVLFVSYISNISNNISDVVKKAIAVLMPEDA